MPRKNASVTPTPAQRKDPSMWDSYTVVIEVEKLSGGVPMHPAMVKGWLEAKAGINIDLEAAAREVVLQGKSAEMSPEQIQEQVDALLADKASKGHVTFKDQDGRCYIEARQVKALMKEAANILKDRLNRPGLRSKVAERLFVHGTDPADPQRIFLYRNGKPLTRADLQTDERPIQVMTAQGPRTSLKTTDSLENVTLEFRISLLRDRVPGGGLGKGAVTIEMVAEFLAFAQENGLGADRSQGSGAFKVVEITAAPARALPSTDDLLQKFRAAGAQVDEASADDDEQDAA